MVEKKKKSGTDTAAVVTREEDDELYMSKVDRRSDANQQKGSHVHTMNQREDRKGHSKHQAHKNRKTMEPEM